MKRGHVTAHFIVNNRSSGMEERTTAGATLAEKTWGRALVAHRVSACGAANFEEVPGREQYGAGDDATAQWVENMLAFHEENSTRTRGLRCALWSYGQAREVKEEERTGGGEKRRNREGEETI